MAGVHWEWSLNLKRGDQRGGGAWNTWGGGRGSPIGKAVPKLCSRWRHSHQTPRERCPWKVCNDLPTVVASGSALPPGHKGDLKFPGYVLSCSQDSAFAPVACFCFFKLFPLMAEQLFPPAVMDSILFLLGV